MRCPFCLSDELHKVRPRVRADGTRVQRYQCQSCGKYFQENYVPKKPKRDLYGYTTFSGNYIVVTI